MRLMWYNVFEDNSLCHDEYIDLLVEIVSQEDPDVLALGEVSAPELKALEMVYPHSYSAARMGKKTEIAVLSKARAAPVWGRVDGIRNPAVEMVTGGFSLYAVHLSATKGEDLRVEEMQKVMAAASGRGECIICGDLNALSPHDGYDAQEVERGHQRYGHAKFGIPVQYCVIPLLESQGLTDCLLACKANSPTAPTREGTTELEKTQHFMPLRLDYVFATSGLAGQVKRGYVVRNRMTEKCSDHYPVVVDFTDKVWK